MPYMAVCPSLRYEWRDHELWESAMAKKLTRDPDVYAEASIAAILTVAIMPAAAGGHSCEEVIQRYKETLLKLRTSTGGAFSVK